MTIIYGDLGTDRVVAEAVRTALVSLGLHSKTYTSGQMTYTNSGLVGGAELLHGLGALPTAIFIDAVCVTAEGGWVAGDVMPVLAGPDGAATAAGFAIKKTTTGLTIRAAIGGVVGLNPSTGAGFILTPANWRLIVRAWA